MRAPAIVVRESGMKGKRVLITSDAQSAPGKRGIEETIRPGDWFGAQMHRTGLSARVSRQPVLISHWRGTSAFPL
jgi:hypothetical protein